MIEKQYIGVNSIIQSLSAYYNDQAWVDTEGDHNFSENIIDVNNINPREYLIWIDPNKKIPKQSEQNINISIFHLSPNIEVWRSDSGILENYISSQISIVREVEFVFSTKENDQINLWIIVNNPDRKVRDSLYDIEFDILKKFTNNNFDFHIMYREGKDIKEILPSNYDIIFRR